MNKIDSFFVMFSLALVWIFMVFLLPPLVMLSIHVTISAWSVGKFIGKLPARMSGQTDEQMLKQMYELNDDQNKLSTEMLRSLNVAASANNTLLARIDELMFEYCPEEMTPKQIAAYEAHQRAVSLDEEVERARYH